MQSSRKRLTIIAATLLAAAVAVGFFLWPNGLEKEASHRAYVAWAVEYPDLGALIASSDLVVHGSVTAVVPGPEHTSPNDEAVLTERNLTVAIEQTFFQSDRAPEVGSSIAVADGWWRENEGYEVADQPWLQEGDEAYFFLWYNADLDRYDSVGPESRIELTGEGLHPTGEDDAAVWASGANQQALADDATLEELIEGVVAEVEAGQHEPVMFEVCEPSVPGDENSEPVCTMTY